MKFTFHIKDANEKIKDAALSLLVKENYKDITMRKVAKEADVALGQVTYYYHTKESLLFSVIKDVATIAVDDFVKKIKKSKGDKEDAIKEYLNNTIMQDGEISTLVVNVMNETLFNAKLKTLSNQFFNRVLNYLISTFKEEDSKISDAIAKEKAEKLMDYALLSIVKKAISLY